ncbi:DUF397 domain-containing protein [Streptomyces violascens]|uniref:DUF397 domain-containing protein n=1 Tax=Streptomyces violascens TaxID=67381 RepID=UPI00367CD06E
MWRKSSFSGENDFCLEVADRTRPILVRDSKMLDTQVLSFTSASWGIFISATAATGNTTDS